VGICTMTGIQGITTVLKTFRSFTLRTLANILKLANIETHFAFKKVITQFTRQGMQLHCMNSNALQHDTNNRKTIFSAVSCPNIIYSEEVLNLSQSITEQTCINVVIHFPQIMVKVFALKYYIRRPYERPKQWLSVGRE